MPKSAPITVTLIEPVDGTLNWVVGTAALSPRTDRSKENASVTEPTRTPAVTATRNVPCTPLATLHTVDVSDCQSLAWHAVTPTRWESVERYVPKSAPTTVTLIEPVDGTLNMDFGRAALSPSTGTLKDKASVTVPSRMPTVTSTLRVAPSPIAERQIMAVSATQSVASHAVDSKRA